MVIADTGFWVALANPRDKYNQIAKQHMQIILKQREQLITTCAVMTETCHLLLRELGTTAQQNFIELYHCQGFTLFELNVSHANRIAELMSKYSNLPMDLADASLVILAEHLGHGRILSTDQRDFGVYRWKQTHPFVNLMFS